MTISNGEFLLHDKPIKNMVDTKVRSNGYSYGLGEAGYDIRIAESIRFIPGQKFFFLTTTPKIFRWDRVLYNKEIIRGNFCLASTLEEFQMPNHLVGVVHDKSTWARQGLSVFNTVIEPGWKGTLTLELVFNGSEELEIEAGTGIAQVLFHEIEMNAEYEGKYQNAIALPQSAILD